MRLKKLLLINFKNILQSEIALTDGINCFVGDNGAGKTNILDAIYYLSMSKSAFTMTDGQIAEKVKKIFDMTPYAIVERFGLKNPIYFETAKYGHFGRDPFRREVTLYRKGKEQKKEVDFFAWEKLDYVEKIQKAFKLS